MAERKKLLDSEAIVYSGLFNFNEVYKLIDGFFSQRGFDKIETFNEEKVTASGRDIDILLESQKMLSHYYRWKMKIRIYVKGLKDVEVEKDGVKVKINQGKFRVEFSAYLITDIGNKWNKTPFKIAVRTLVDKYFYPKQLKRDEDELKQITRHCMTLVKSYLNLHKH